MARQTERRVRGGRVEVTTRMPPELVERLRRAADANGLTVNEFMCRICDDNRALAEDEIERLERRAQEIARRLIEDASRRLTLSLPGTTKEVAA